jgi:hypothetical protein
MDEDRPQARSTKPGARREELEKAYLKLPREERRSRLLILPYFANKRDELLNPDNVVQQYRYFWDNWVPSLGPVASMLYMKLRQYCYYNRQTGEIREYCFPKQSTLGREIGIKDEKTVRKALKLLEKHGLLRREEQYRYDQRMGKKVRTTDRYWVSITDILTPDDEVSILLTEIEDNQEVPVNRENRPTGKYSRQVKMSPTEEPSPTGKYSRHISGGNIPQQEEVLIRNTPNVINVSSNQDKSFRNHPTVRALTAEERASKEGTAFEVGETLKTMAGDRDLDDHQSAGFHRRVAFLMPERFVREAIVATRDAVDDDRSGRRKLRAGPAAYFAGIVRQIAEREEIDLGVDWKAKKRTGAR